MTQYALFFNTQTNKPHSAVIYRDEQIPPQEVWPPNTDLFVFDETTPNFNKLYGIFVDDKEKVYLDYDAFNTVRDPVTGEFTFPLMEKMSNIEQIRWERNKKMEESDAFIYAPDLPESIMQELLAYRQALRDITNGIDPETPTYELNWPVLPEPFRPAPRMDI